MRSGYLRHGNHSTTRALFRRGMIDDDGQPTLVGRHVRKHLKAVA
jgi:hypothetical protein